MPLDMAVLLIDDFSNRIYEYDNVVRYDFDETENIFTITSDESFDQTAEAQHGDWVLEAFVSELEDDVYANTQIICIDVETGANGTYSSGDELSKLLGFDAFFSHEENGFLYYHPDTVDGWEVHPELGVGYIPEIAVPIETILEDMGYLNDDGSADAMVCFSMSISGADAMDYEVPTIEFFDSLKFPLIQAAPNTSQGPEDWGTSYDDQVINVGAWTVGTSDFLAYETAQDGTLIFPPGEGLLSSPGTLNTLDILANGVVFHDWNDGVTSEGTFGTSFATPRVAGQMVNSFYNMNPDYVDFIRDNLTHDQAFQIWLDFNAYKISYV